MKVLRVGDPHVKPSNIDESELFLQFILDKARELKVDTIEILGDLFHTHAIIRLEVLEFWHKWLWKLSEEFVTIVLVGNHDIGGDLSSDSHSLSVFVGLNPDKLHIIERPAMIQGIGYLPYIHDNATFIKEANTLAELGAKVLVSHTTYQGSKFENGFYAPDGVDPEQVGFTLMISGHVHARQRFVTNKGQVVIYPGTGRWDTASDANQEKGLWLVDHAEDGSIAFEEFLDTKEVCSPIVSVTVREGEELPEIPDGTRMRVELIGSSDWIAKQKMALKGRASISTKITDKAKLESRKSGTTLEYFLQNVYVSTMDRENLLKVAKELGLV